MCFSWKFKNSDEVHTWHPAYPHLDIEEEGRAELDQFLGMVGRGEVVMEAHNAFFEQCIWLNVCVPYLGWPEAPVRMWRCSAAKCSTHGLPRSLEGACDAMGTGQRKDMAGSKVSKKLWKPKKDGTWHETVEEFRVLWEYNRQDVRAEEDLSSQLEDLPPFEQEMWFMDQEVNFRGVLVDRALCEKALELVEELKRRNNVRFEELTGLKSASQREAFKTFCWLSDVSLPNTTGETLSRMLAAHEEAKEKSRKDPTYSSHKILDDDVAEAMSIVYENNRTSTRKYNTALSVMDDDDDRVRGSIMYAGAERTWRWAGRLIQPHNYPRGVIADMVAACNFILDNDLDTIIAEMNMYSKKNPDGSLIGFKDVMEFLSHALRGMIMSEEGRILSVSDFAAIEARVLFFLADEEEALKVLASGQCIYCDLATDIYGYLCNKKDHPDERQLGKQGILGLGFGMGDAKFVATCAKYNIEIDDKLAQRVVKTYRKKYKKVSQSFWPMQEDAAVLAVLLDRKDGVPPDYEVNPELTVDEDGWVVAGKIAWRKRGKFLRCRLPSGRCNVYPFPTLATAMTYYIQAETLQRDESERVKRWITVTNYEADEIDWTQAVILDKAKRKIKALGAKVRITSNDYKGRIKFSLVYKGKDTDHKTNAADGTPNKQTGKQREWADIHTYSGKITENIVQGTARDLMAAAMLRCHLSGDYDVTLSVHDELVTEVDEWLGDLEAFNTMMATPPDWAVGCPIGAEGWRGLRYRK